RRGLVLRERVERAAGRTARLLQRLIQGSQERVVRLRDALIRVVALRERVRRLPLVGEQPRELPDRLLVAAARDERAHEVADGAGIEPFGGRRAADVARGDAPWLLRREQLLLRIAAAEQHRSEARRAGQHR